MAAINKAQATIEFKMDGTVITANENFLRFWDTAWTKSRANITACSSMKRTGKVQTTRNSGQN